MEEGILAPVARLDRWLEAVLVVLLVTCSVRYLLRHDLDAHGGARPRGCGRPRRRLPDPPARGRRPRRGRYVWVTVVVVLWVALTLVAPSFAWTAVPVAFAVLQVLPFAYAVDGRRRHDRGRQRGAGVGSPTSVDPTVVVGPVGIALVTVLSYRALEREARTRQTLSTT